VLLELLIYSAEVKAVKADSHCLALYNTSHERFVSHSFFTPPSTQSVYLEVVRQALCLEHPKSKASGDPNYLVAVILR
jgi:hypothetical protein